MATRLDVFRCEDCGLLLEITNDVDCQYELKCGDRALTQLVENTVDAAREKHVPVAEAAGGALKVTVGSVPHPMDDDHFIEWIEVIDGDTVIRKNLKPGQAPEAVFPVTGDGVTVREHCNLHGLWKA